MQQGKDAGEGLRRGEVLPLEGCESVHVLGAGDGELRPVVEDGAGLFTFDSYHQLWSSSSMHSVRLPRGEQ